MIGLRVERFDGVPVVYLPAEIDAASAGRLRDKLIPLLRNDAVDVVLVLDGTSFLDSAGIDLLFRLSQRLSERRAAARVVVAADSHLRRLTELVGLDRAMPVYETLAEALAAVPAHAAGTAEVLEPGAPRGAGGCR